MDPDTAANPQPMFKALRESMPVMAVDGVGVVLTGREPIDDAFRDPETFSSNMSAVDLKNVRPLIPLQIDPPEHKKYRKILDPIFAPRQMALLEPSVNQLVNDLIDGFDGRSEIDFASEFSVPFPSQVFLTLLGLPLDELPRFLAMKDGIIRPDQVTGTAYGSDEMNELQRATANSIYEYFDEILDEREVERRDDLLSHFLDAEVDGERLKRTEILDICFLFLIAGLDTVTATLDCMFAFLAQHDGHRRQLVDQPELIPAAVEELLRWETPVMGVARVATRDTKLGGCPVNKGDQVMVMLGAANTDEHEFEDAETVRFDRAANRHLAFGGGIHRCLGSHLARQELRIALREWHRRIPDYSVAPGHTLAYTSGIRSIEYFPMVIGPAR
ncbi:MAG TPA: cytochrome P450 [Acidimicrobiia bacterium]|nr:cytochrome P450 [Acidimicrobiia bacterium]